jgi:hydrogenase/urease accessory protein HupE
MAAGLSGAAYACGFTASTALLLSAGVALGRGLSRRGLDVPARLVGSAVMVAGLLLLAV